MKGFEGKNKQKSRGGKSWKGNRNRTKSNNADSFYDIDYVSKMIDSMEFHTGDSGLLDDMLEDQGDWD